MGHRALVLYETANGLFNVHYSHWGAADLKLAAKLSQDDPWGGEKSEPAGFTEMVALLTEAAGDETEIGGYAAEASETTEVNPDPLARNVTVEEAFNELVDAVHHEAVFVVIPDRETGEFNVTAFRPVSMSIPGEPHRESEDIEFLAFSPRWVGERPVSDARRRGIATGMKKTLGAFSGEDGVVSADAIDGLWPDLDGGVKAEMDVGAVIDAVQDATGADTTSLFTYPAARRLLTRLFLADFENSLNEWVSPYSTAVDETLWEAYPESFITMGGRTRVLGEMYPTSVENVEPWSHPDNFPVPKPVTR